MSKKTSTTAPKTVRMFDGKTWDTYTVGSKAHKKAEARRAAWEATRPSKAERAAQRAKAHETNTYLATAMRAAELVPSGSAWTAFKAGERDVTRLAEMNAADGLVFRAPKAKAEQAPEKAPKAGKKAKAERKAAQVTAPVVETAPVAEETERPSKAERKAAKRRSKAARKAYATRVANGTAVRVNGRFVKAESAQAPVEEAKPAKKGKRAQIAATVEVDETFAAPLRNAGLSDAQIALAWSLR
ncbi:MAG: hypothetical protein HOV97_05445 [Nonomuraea sp.]|nr:hypothetical protein [Nonomuraea sp.]